MAWMCINCVEKEERQVLFLQWGRCKVDGLGDSSIGGGAAAVEMSSWWACKGKEGSKLIETAEVHGGAHGRAVTQQAATAFAGHQTDRAAKPGCVHAGFYCRRLCLWAPSRVPSQLRPGRPRWHGTCKASCQAPRSGGAVAGGGIVDGTRG